MAALPEAYRSDRVYEGMLSPDYAALAAAVPPRAIEGQDLEIVPLRELGDRILGVSEALVKIGKQGVFGYMYGTLTHFLADAVDGKSYATDILEIEEPDDLMVQANHFSHTWTDPVASYGEQAVAGAAGDYILQQKIVADIPDHWLYALEAPEIQFGEEVTQFSAGGMEEHILADLGISLVRAQVSFAYMRPGGDYDNVNKAIRYITTDKAPELIDGRPTVVRAAVQPVASVIGGMRYVAKGTHRRLLQAEGPEQFEAIQDKAISRAITASRMTARYGDAAIQLFARAAGAKQLAQQLGSVVQRTDGGL